MKKIKKAVMYLLYFLDWSYPFPEIEKIHKAITLLSGVSHPKIKEIARNIIEEYVEYLHSCQELPVEREKRKIEIEKGEKVAEEIENLCRKYGLHI